jgi:hypothetical protein
MLAEPMAMRALALLMLLCVYAMAGERRIHFEDDHTWYDLTFDPARIPPQQMRQMVVLSPFLRVAVARPFSFVETWRRDAPADRQLEIRPLEACNPGYAGCEKNLLDAAFLANAAKNLERDKEEIRQLRRLRLPKELKQVRSYLLDQAEFLLSLEQARYKYFARHDLTPLRKVMCEICPCTGAAGDILENLRTAPPQLGYRVTDDWFNHTLGCHEAITLKYPVEAWRGFTLRYGITEKYGAKPKG